MFESTITIWMAIIGTGISGIGLMFGLLKYILTAKITPLDVKIKENAEELKKKSTLITDLKEAFLEELSDIALANANFRLETEKQLSEVKEKVSDEYARKEDSEKRLKEIHARVTENKEDFEKRLTELKDDIKTSNDIHSIKRALDVLSKKHNDCK